MTAPPADALGRLARQRGNPAVAVVGGLDPGTHEILYDLLRALGPVPRLDVVLSTTGGRATTARRLALLLREYAKHLTVLVPYRAWSAGTLLCLAADHLVLSPMAELGPIDPRFTAGATTAGEPGVTSAARPSEVSAEDVRAFPAMATDWFGVQRAEDSLQVLALVAQRIFPTTLAGLYRADRLTRQIAAELVRHQLPDVEEAARSELVERLVTGYHGHDYPLTRVEARHLGLRVADASAAEESLLWDVMAAGRRRCLAVHADVCLGAATPDVEPEAFGGWRIVGGTEDGDGS